MANRSYLYSSDHLPESPEWLAKKKLHGIAEYRYDIPLVFKILLGGDPVAVKSSIWDTTEKIAIAGDYARGVKNLTGYVARIADPVARPLIDEALGFLNSPAHARKHFILESGEIFELSDKGLGDSSMALLGEIRDLGARISSLEVPKPAKVGGGFLSRLFGSKAPDPRSPYYEIGLGSWTDILYFDFSENEA